MKNILSLFILILISTIHSYSQPPGEGWVKMDKGDLIISEFNIQDWYTRERFTDKDVTVSIYKEDSTTLITKQIWYSGSYYKGKRSVDSAIAFIPVLKRIVIKVEKEGYDTFVQAVDLPDEKDLKKGKDGKYHWNGLKKMLIHRSIATTQLGEAEVTASRLQMVVKGDTLEYNVANLRLSAGSMLDNLIRNLPGAQLDKNGKITINGEFVSRLLVNGREFFNGDPLVALKNLPYYTVGKIKAYHDIGTYFNSEADSLRALANAPLTMDVRLKKIYSEMWLANFEVGEGSRTHTDWNNVYFGRFFAMRFTDHSNIGIYGIANNVGKNYSATHDGNWREMQAFSGGMPETQSGGIDFSVDGKKTKLEFKTNLNLSHEKNEVEHQLSNQRFLSTGDIFARSRMFKQSKSYNVNWKASLSKKSGRNSFSISPRLTYTNGDENQAALSASFDSDPMETGRTAALDSLWNDSPSERLNHMTISRTRSKGRTQSNNLYTGASADASLYLGRFRKSSKYIQIYADVNYSRRTFENLVFTEVGTPKTTYFDNRFSSSPEHSLNASARVSYSLFNYHHNRWRISSSIEYKYDHKYDYKERALYKNQDKTPEWLPDMNTGYVWEYNLRNSYLTDLYTDDHTTGLNFNIGTPGLRKERYVDLRVKIPLHADIRRVVDNRNNREQELRKRFCYFTPAWNSMPWITPFAASMKSIPHCPA